MSGISPSNAKTIEDLMFKGADFPMADEIARRLATWLRGPGVMRAAAIQRMDGKRTKPIWHVSAGLKGRRVLSPVRRARG